MISNIVTVVLLLLSFVLLLLNNHTREKLKHQIAQVDSIQNDAEVVYQQALKIVNRADTLGKETYAFYHSKAGYKVQVLTNSKATPFFKEDERGIVVIIAKENTP